MPQNTKISLRELLDVLNEDINSKCFVKYEKDVGLNVPAFFLRINHIFNKETGGII